MPKEPTEERDNTENMAKDMELSGSERLYFRTLFPQQGDILTQTLVRDINNKIQLTQGECKRIDLKNKVDGPGIQWNVDKAAKLTLGFRFTEAEIDFLKAQVARLDKEKKVTPEILDLCLKIRELGK